MITEISGIIEDLYLLIEDLVVIIRSHDKVY